MRRHDCYLAGWLFAVLVFCLTICFANRATLADSRLLENLFREPPAEARPWVFWYWLHGRVSPEGITADLEAMHLAGIGGAYLMPIRGPESPPQYVPSATQLSPRFWRMVRHAAREADRLGLELGMHACDGFAVAGGPWISPELSMQQVVWSTATVTGGKSIEQRIPQPQTREGYYQDIATLAFPTPQGENNSQPNELQVSTSDGEPNANRLSKPGNEQRYRSAEPCWIEFAYDQPFTCRSIAVTPDGSNYQCQRLRILASDDREAFHQIAALVPPRHGWQEEGQPVTHSIPPTTACTFRLQWDPQGTEPGSEDLDMAKWSPVLKVKSIILSSEARISNYRGKSGAMWRVGSRTTPEQLPNEFCVPRDSIVDLSRHIDEQGKLEWDAPPGQWTLLRFGHTSTGRRNATGGGGQGLECDKLNPKATRLQFDRWFGEARRQVADEIGETAAKRVLSTFHVDSWECGSQNWTPRFRERFLKKYQYDLTPYLPCLAGVPVGSADVSERFLRDMRGCITDLMDQSFYGVLAKITQEKGLRFTGECTAPTMMGDGLRHFASLDAPMGEFWLESPTHDKPNDMLDAISGGHIYGKRIIQAEAFTQLRIGWDESPTTLKGLGDRNLALGANKLVMHVFTHNPWMDRKPGQTLDGIGLYFQRDQPWLAAGRGWMQHLARCQALLQQGSPVADIAVWTGSELPSRSFTPNRLVKDLPGLVGKYRMDSETRRLSNRGQPLREMPMGVRASANLFDLGDWNDPLRGYAYDSINSDAILNLASAKDGRLVLPGGSRYKLLVLPSRGPLTTTPARMMPEMAEKIADFVEAGVTVLWCEPIASAVGLSSLADSDQQVQHAVARMKTHPERFLQGPWRARNLEKLGLQPDWVIAGDDENAVESISHDIAWTHRAGEDWDIYFISNQSGEPRRFKASLRANRRSVEVWNPVTGEMRQLPAQEPASSRTETNLTLAPHESLFVVLSDEPRTSLKSSATNQRQTVAIDGPWSVSFESALEDTVAPRSNQSLVDLSRDPDGAVRHFVGKAIYSTKFEFNRDKISTEELWLTVGAALPLAQVSLNGQKCGVLWTPPWRLNVAEHIRPGVNQIEFRVASTWKNRLLAEVKRPDSNRQTWTSAPLRLKDQSLTPFGLIGPVQLHWESP